MKAPKNHRKTTATNKRNALFKYYKVDETHNYVVPAGRCKCSKITDIFCDNCQSYICEKHIFKDKEQFFCEQCKTDNSQTLSKKEIRKIKQAKLFK